MRALRLDGSARLVTDHPRPVPAPGEALIAVRRAALSPTDVALAASPSSSRFTGTLGQELVGIVREVNLASDTPPHIAARRTLVDKRVTCAPSIACSRCDLCRAGLASHCRTRRILGAAGADGCLAEYVVAPLLNLVAVPSAMPDDTALFAPSLARAIHVAHLVRSGEQRYVTVLGDNLTGLLASQALSHLNTSVRLLGERPERGALCDKWGVKHRPLAEAGRRQDQDVVIECTGTPLGLRLAMQFVRPRGTIILKPPVTDAATPLPAPTEAPLDLTPIATGEITLIGTREGPLPDALDLLARAEVDVAPLISRRFRLDDAVKALEAAGSPESLKVVVDVADR